VQKPTRHLALHQTVLIYSFNPIFQLDFKFVKRTFLSFIRIKRRIGENSENRILVADRGRGVGGGGEGLRERDDEVAEVQDLLHQWNYN